MTGLLNRVDERRSPRTEATVNELLDRWLEAIDVERTTRTGYIGKIEKHIRPTIGRLAVGRVKAETIESLHAQLRRCRDHCRGERFVQHRTEGEHVCDEHSARRKCAKVTTGDPDAACRWCDRACGAHRCTPLAAGSIRVVHAILSGAFLRAVRWGWIAVSPNEQTEPPAVPRPTPRRPRRPRRPRSSARRGRTRTGACWCCSRMTTGARRGELCGLRWSPLDLEAGVAVFKGSVAQIAGDVWEKGTRTHQHRCVTLDAELVDVLSAHRSRCDERAALLDTAIRRDGFVFSPAPDCSTRTSPNTVTQRYGRLAARLGIDTHLHSVRHYSATELIAAGVDIRTVAGRIGHSGGGSTTLRTSTAASVHQADPGRPDRGGWASECWDSHSVPGL